MLFLHTFKHIFLVYECSCFEYIEEMIQKQEPLSFASSHSILYNKFRVAQKAFWLFKASIVYHEEVILNLLSLLFCWKCMLVFYSWLFQINNYFFSLTFWLGYLVIMSSWFRRELLHSYGFEHMATLNNLEKAGLLKKQV